MQNVQIFQYNETPVSFLMGDENRMISATDMARSFGKEVKQWFDNESTHEFIHCLAQIRGVKPIGGIRTSLSTTSLARNYPSLIKVVKGGMPGQVKQGTWLNEDVALEFARWLSPMFAIWCNDRIKELLRFGLTATEEMLIKAATDPRFVLAMMTQIKESHEKTRLLEQQNRLLEQQAEQNATKVQFYDNLQEIRQKDEAGRIYNVSKIARELGMSPAGLNKLLIRKGVAIKIDGSWYIADRYKDSGYAVERKTLSQRLNEDDEMVPTEITYLAWTSKGRDFIYSLIEK